MMKLAMMQRYRPGLTATAAACLLAGSVAVGLLGGQALAQSQGQGYGGGAEHQSGGSHGGSHAGGGGGQKGAYTGGQMRGKGGAGAVPSGTTSTTTTDDEKKGPQYKGGAGGGSGTPGGGGGGGGKPVWAQEGIPEVELGRLNVSRSPGHVIDKAFEEALDTFPAAATDLYSKSAEEYAAIVAAQYDTVSRVDSPLQNLGLYRDVMQDGSSDLTQKGVTPASQLDLGAILLGSASDKNIPVSTDTVIAINKIMGLPALSDTDTGTLAAKAEAVRQAILTGHGS